MKPALTAEEWTKGKDRKRILQWRGTEGIGITHYSTGEVGVFPDYQGDIQPASQLHSIAALCLHNQAFGFTHADLIELKDAAAMYRSMYGKTIEDAFLIEDIAERIKALLPPSEKSVI